MCGPPDAGTSERPSNAIEWFGPMAKAADKPTPITWISLLAARDLAAEVYYSDAEQWLVEQIAARRMRWRAKATRPPGLSLDDSFFRNPATLTVNSAECSATQLMVMNTSAGTGLEPITAYGLEVVREDIEARLPEDAQHRESFKGLLTKLVQDNPDTPGEEMVHYADRLKALLEKHPKATKKMREAGRRSIAARLYELGLGPRQA
jgi:hypothetical protein